MKLLPSKPIHADDNLGRGMDLALLVGLFLGFGYLLDRWLGTRPVFMIVMVLVGFVGSGVRMWLGYEAKMHALEAERLDRSMPVRRERLG